MIRFCIPVVLCIIFFSCCRGKKHEKSDISSDNNIVVYQTVKDITKEDLRYHIGILASDSLEGRKAGSIGEKMAGEYIKNKFTELGLSKFSDDYIHPFSFIERWSYYSGEFNTASFVTKRKNGFINFLPVDSANVSSNIIFIGNEVNYSQNGFFLGDHRYIDIENKWVMIFEKNKLNESIYRLASGIIEGSDEKKKSASGILAINVEEDTNGDLVSLENWYDVVRGIKPSIPVIRIFKKTADSLFKLADVSTEEMLEIYEDISLNIPANVNASVTTDTDSLKSSNIIAYIEGNDSVLKNEFIVLGAHYDHMGINKNDDKVYIYNGADDNASGVAGLLEIAEKLVSERIIKRSIIFMAYGAEEEGLIGSRHISENLPVPASQIKLMINLDMIGRMDSCNLFVNSVVGGTPADEKIGDLGALYPELKINFASNEMPNSDHYPFFEKNIPVVMLTTGTHGDYHTPRDTIDAINYEGEKLLLDLTYDLVVSFAEKTDEN